MKKGMILVLAVAFLAVASTASAEIFQKGQVLIEARLVQFVSNTVDTFFFGGIDNHNALGFGGNFTYSFSDMWAWELGGFFGFGNEKWEYAGDDVKWKVSAFGVGSGILRTVNINDQIGLFFGPGFEWVSARSSVEDNDWYGIGDWENPRANTISLVTKMGVLAKLGEHFGLKGHLGKKWSIVSFSENVGGDELKVSGWTTSIDGAAGFVFFIK